MRMADRLVRGTRITLMGTVLAQAMQLALVPLLARLITPVEYGLIAGAMVVLAPLAHLVAKGAERALIVAAALPTAALDSIMLFQLALAVAAMVALAALVWAGLPLATEPALLLSLLPLVLLAAGSAVLRAVLYRRLAFGRLVAIDAASQMIGGLLTLAAAVAGWGAYALVAGLLAQALLQAVFCAFAAGHRFGWRWDRRAALPILATGLNLTRTSILETLHGQMPAAAVGWALGAASLGLYNRVYHLVQLPAEILVGSLTRVAFGGLAQMRQRKSRLRRGAGMLVQTSAALALPVCAGMAPAGPELVAVVLGPRWLDGAALVPWLCLGAAATMLGHVLAVINEAALRLDDRFRIQAAVLAATAAALALAAGAGLVAMIAAVAAGALLYLAMQAALVMRSLGIGLGVLLGWLVPGIAASGACLATLLALKELLPPDATALPRLAADIAGCTAAAAAVYRLCFPALWRRLIRYAVGAVRRKH